MKQFTLSVKTYFLVTAIEVLLAFGYLATVPAAARNEVSGILGFSALRFFTLIGLGLFFFIMIGLWLSIHQKTRIGQQVTSLLYNFSERKAILNLSTVSILGVLVFIYFLYKWLSLEPSYEYSIALERLLPFVFLFLVGFFQLYIIVIFPQKPLNRLNFLKFERWVRSPIPAKTIMMDLFTIAILLVIASILSQCLRFFSPFKPYLDFLIYEFYLDSESNIPTYFSAFLLIFSALLLAVQAKCVGLGKGKFGFQWYLLSAIFIFLSIDEILQFHELLTEPIRHGLQTTGFLYFAWYIPVIPILIILGVYYLRLVNSLPQKHKIGYVISGLIFLSGAIGMEMIGSSFAQTKGLGNFQYSMVATLEESLELIGLILFIYFTWDLVQLNSQKSDLAKPKE
jgi:hypothetical protein